MGRTTYLICATVALVGWITLNNMESVFRWTALGIGAVMLTAAVFTKDKVEPAEEEEEEKDNNLNKKEGNKNGI